MYSDPMGSPSRSLAAAPPLAVSQWFNTDSPISLDDLAGQVVAIEAFQMLCPGCVSHGLPQAQRIAQAFAGDVTVLGLHTVFEHHEAMRPVSLQAFLHEYRIGFPVGVDDHDDLRGTPITMARYQLRGTPSLILIDRNGRIRLNAFGHVDDLVAGAALARLIDEPVAEETADRCDPNQGCVNETNTNEERLQ